MNTLQTMWHCRICDKQTIHIYDEHRCNHILHLLLTICTGGLWLIIWIFAACGSYTTKPKCTICGGLKPGEKPPFMTPLNYFQLAVVVFVLGLVFHFAYTPKADTGTTGVKYVVATPTPVPFAGATPNDEAPRAEFVTTPTAAPESEMTPTPTPTPTPHKHIHRHH
jgi:hypothetical protein